MVVAGAVTVDGVVAVSATTDGGSWWRWWRPGWWWRAGWWQWWPVVGSVTGADIALHHLPKGTVIASPPGSPERDGDVVGEGGGVGMDALCGFLGEDYPGAGVGQLGAQLRDGPQGTSQVACGAPVRPDGFSRASRGKSQVVARGHAERLRRTSGEGTCAGGGATLLFTLSAPVGAVGATRLSRRCAGGTRMHSWSCSHTCLCTLRRSQM